MARGTGLVRGDRKGTAPQSRGGKVRTTRRDSIERASSCVQIICIRRLKNFFKYLKYIPKTSETYLKL